MKDYRAVLQFSDRWFELGIVTEEKLQEWGAIYDSGADPNTEHYRYRAFVEFLSENRPLTFALAEALYDLGDGDPDYAMGGAMVADILRLAECPSSLFDRASRSDRKHLVRITERRRLSNQNP